MRSILILYSAGVNVEMAFEDYLELKDFLYFWYQASRTDSISIVDFFAALHFRPERELSSATK
jgi:hypothetical protein